MYTDLKEIKLYLLTEDMIICVENLKEPKKKPLLELIHNYIVRFKEARLIYKGQSLSFVQQ